MLFLERHVFVFQVSIVGDFSEEEIESCIVDYLGTVSATKDSERLRQEEFTPVVFRPSPSDLQFQQVSNGYVAVSLHLLFFFLNNLT